MTNIEHTIHELLDYASTREVNDEQVKFAKDLYIYFREYQGKEKAFEAATIYLDRMQDLLQKQQTGE